MRAYVGGRRDPRLRLIVIPVIARRAATALKSLLCRWMDFMKRKLALDDK
jgi:hypothetical protein